MATFAWPESWKADLDEAHRLSLLRELHRELPEGHILRGRTCKPLAVLVRDPDTVAIELDCGGYAAVHLTWHKEADPKWPHTTLYETLDELCRPDEWE